MKTYSYKQLCALFNEEEKKKGASRDCQFERWRQNYEIERVGNTYKYTVRSLSIGELALSRTTIKEYMPQLRKLIYNYIVDNSKTRVDGKAGKEMYVTMMDLMKELALVNKFFFANFDNSTLKKKNIDDGYLRMFREEVHDFTYHAIRKILNEMVQRNIIVYEEMFKVTYILDDNVYSEPQYIRKTDTCEIMKERNRIAQNEYLVPYYILAKEEKDIVDGIVKNNLKIKYFPVYLHICSDVDAIDFILEEPEKYLINKDDSSMMLKEMNNYSYLKCLVSKQGQLKEIDETQKTRIAKNIIVRNDL